MENGVPVSGSYYIYAPNQVAPVFFAAMFAVLGLCHVWQCHHYQCTKLTILFPISGFIFAAGFAAREYGAFHYRNLNVYLASTMLIYFGPPLLELQNYHILGRILEYVPYLAPIHPGRVRTTFGILSLLVEVLNAIGVSYAINASLSPALISLGKALLKTSLALQLVVIGAFYALIGFFHLRCARANFVTPKLRTTLLTLYGSSFLVCVRTIFRMVEYLGYANIHAGPGFNPLSLSPILRYEWFFYVFAASPMLANMALWAWHHPRRYLPADHRVYLERDGVTEVQGSGWKDRRPFLVTVVDPCGCCGAEEE